MAHLKTFDLFVRKSAKTCSKILSKIHPSLWKVLHLFHVNFCYNFSQKMTSLTTHATGAAKRRLTFFGSFVTIAGSFEIGRQWWWWRWRWWRHLTAAAASDPSRLEKILISLIFVTQTQKLRHFCLDEETLFTFSSKSGSVRDLRRCPATNKTFL